MDAKARRLAAGERGQSSCEIAANHAADAMVMQGWTQVRFEFANTNEFLVTRVLGPDSTSTAPGILCIYSLRGRSLKC